jgi:hypothetical protein
MAEMVCDNTRLAAMGTVALLELHRRVGDIARRLERETLLRDFARDGFWELDEFKRRLLVLLDVSALDEFKNWILRCQIGPESSSGEPLAGTRQPRNRRPSDKASSASVEEPDPEPSAVDAVALKKTG